MADQIKQIKQQIEQQIKQQIKQQIEQLERWSSAWYSKENRLDFYSNKALQLFIKEHSNSVDPEDLAKCELFRKELDACATRVCQFIESLQCNSTGTLNELKEYYESCFEHYLLATDGRILSAIQDILRQREDRKLIEAGENPYIAVAMGKDRVKVPVSDNALINCYPKEEGVVYYQQIDKYTYVEVDCLVCISTVNGQTGERTPVTYYTRNPIA